MGESLRTQSADAISDRIDVNAYICFNESVDRSQNILVA